MLIKRVIEGRQRNAAKDGDRKEFATNETALLIPDATPT